MANLCFPMFVSTLMHGNIHMVVTYTRMHETFMRDLMHRKCVTFMRGAIKFPHEPLV